MGTTADDHIPNVVCEELFRTTLTFQRENYTDFNPFVGCSGKRIEVTAHTRWQAEGKPELD